MRILSGLFGLNRQTLEQEGLGDKCRLSLRKAPIISKKSTDYLPDRFKG